MTPNLLATALALSPAPAAVSPPAEETAPAASPADGEAPQTPEAVAEAIEAAEVRANEDPSSGVPALAALLDEVSKMPIEIAGAPAVRAARTWAYLTLARGYLTLQDEDRAREAVYEAILLASPESPPAEQFGPTLEAFYRARRDELERRGRHTIHVECGVPCRVFVDERAVPSGRAEGLLAGPHRLHVEPAPKLWKGRKPPRETVLDMTVLLDEDHREVTIPYAPPSLVAPPAPPRAEDRPGARPLLPLWAEGLGIGLGTAGVAAGATLLALDGRCAGPEKDPMRCENLYELTAGGAVTTAVGGALLVTSVVLLAVDLHRRGKAGRAGDQARLRAAPGGLAVRF